jgi:hypothetical protein
MAPTVADLKVYADKAQRLAVEYGKARWDTLQLHVGML